MCILDISNLNKTYSMLDIQDKIIYRNGKFTILKLSKKVFQILEEIDNNFSPVYDKFKNITDTIKYCENELKRNRKKHHIKYNQHLRINHRLSN